VLDAVFDSVADVGAFIAGRDYVFTPLYLITSLAIAAVAGVALGDGGRSLWSFLFPKAVYRHASVRLDAALTALNTFIIGLGGLSFTVLTPAVAASLNVLIGIDASAPAVSISYATGLAVAVLLFLIDDFCRFALHFAHHKLPVLWPFHEVHHSAQVLMPMTFFRAHPVYFFVQRLLISTCSGALQGIVAVTAFGAIEDWVFYAASLPPMVYMLAGVHLRHSHIPVRYGRWGEAILISPYLHQLHHSIDPAHRDVNFGEVLSVWDRLFGTLRRPAETVPLTFGLTDERGNSVQPYPDIATALFGPFGKAAHALARGLSIGPTRRERG
jgi:sterol desaturase/sphingolipid hydroxylase (fatty acid hydroxylase superfamily)